MTLFRSFFDDAALFPPGNSALGEAIRAHRGWRASPDAALVGDFVVAASRVHELAKQVPRDVESFRVSVTVPDISDSATEVLQAVESHPRMDLVALEAPMGRLPLGDGLTRLAPFVAAGVATYAELAWVDVDPAVCEWLADHGVRLKVRVGGLAADAFPSEEVLAHILHAAVVGGVAFKLTAGLHRAVRHRDQRTGFEHHGFVNVLAATALARGGAAVADLVPVLARNDPEVLLAQLTTDERRAVRSIFLSIGTCSLDEPLADLTALGLRDEPAERIRFL